MKEGVRSSDPSAAKKKSSFGCLIIKKKGDGIGGLGGSAFNKVFNSGKEKKRAWSISSDSGSSDEVLERFRRNVVSGKDELRNNSVVYKKGFVEGSSFGQNCQIGNERKRSGLDVFEFDEYDGFDGKKLRKDYVDDRLKLAGRSGNQRDDGTGSSQNVVVENRKRSYFDSTSNMVSRKSKENTLEMEDDDAHLPLSLLRKKYREASEEPIRLQGKNGVLKVMVNKKKKPGLSHRRHDHQEAEERKGSRSEDAVKKNVVIRPSLHSDKLRKSLPTKCSKGGDCETGDSDTDPSLKQGLTSMRACSSVKVVKKEGKRTTSTENITPIRNEDKIKRGTSTEKQLLREKIRNMLFSAGWTIDYRPRRNRDYLDAVYISPTGTAYWSIVKAYDALHKQLEEEDGDIKPCGDSSPFNPLPEEILSKLTRQTQKKIEREMKKNEMEDSRSKNSKEASVKESAEGTHSDQHEEKLSFFMKRNRKSLKGRLHEADHVIGESPKQDRVEKPSISTNSHVIHGRKGRKNGRSTLLVRSSDKGLHSETDGFVSYTRKLTLLSWLIDSGIVQMSEKVKYMNRRKTRIMLEGWITRDGIHCGCCSKILTVSKFGIHAGSKLRHPFPNIFLESGLSLMQCQIDAWNRQEESERWGFHTVDTDGDDPNDDTCGICADGGDLICCDGCPSTFHQSCLDLQMLPPGDWHCPNCTCKFCGIASRSIVEDHGRTVSALLTCSLCNKKYHESCSQDMDDLPVGSNNATTSFCGRKCGELFGHLQKLLGEKHELEGGFSWSLIHRMDPLSDMLHLEFSQVVECNSKLAVARSVMNECFLPIIDRRSGVNLVHNVLYNCGSNFSRLNYSGFYTAILERGDEIISAASIRIHGTQLAEMPFIGTRHIYRRQGMCRRLLCAIESALCSLKVEKLIIPAVAEHMHTWTEVFKFHPLEELHKQEMSCMNMLVFPETDMLQKLLAKQEIPEGNKTANLDTKSVEVKENHLLLPVLAKKTELDSSPRHDLHACDDAGVQHVNETNGKVVATDSGLQAPAVPSNYSDVSAPCEPKLQFSGKETISISSQLVNKLEESAADLKCLSPSDASPIILEIGNPVLEPPVGDNILSSAEGVVGDAHEVNVEASCIELGADSLGETSEVASDAEIAPAEGNMQSFSEGSEWDVHEMNVESGSSVEISAKSTTENVKENPRFVVANIQSFAKGSERDAHEVNVKGSCVGPIPGSLLESSTQSTTEVLDKNQSPVSLSIPLGIGERIVQSKSELDQPNAIGMDNELHVPSELLSDTEVASDAKVASVEVNIRSSAVGDGGDDHEAKIACKLALSVNTTEEIYENCNPLSTCTLCGTDEGPIQSNSDLNHQSAHEVESKLTATSEFDSGEKVAPVESNIQSSAVDDMDDIHQVNVNATRVEPILDSFGEIAAKNTAEEVIENQNPITVSTFHGTDEITIGFEQTAFKVESKLLVASEVVSVEFVAAAETNIEANGGDEVGDASGVTAKVPCAEPTLDSLGETLAHNNNIQAINENLTVLL